MTKYYAVYLSTRRDLNNYKYRIICTKMPFLNLFKEIITDRIIYPYNLCKGLIYGHSYKMPLGEVETWLQSMNKEKIAQHVQILQTIEKENLQYYEETKIKAQQEISKSKSVSKTIKKSLRQIKQR